MRKGEVIKTEASIFYFVTSLPPEKASPKKLLKLARGHWAIENGQHYRRDRTQDEDRCQVHHTMAARTLSLFRSLTIFLYEEQRGRSKGKKSLPDFERHITRQPTRMIRRFMQG